MRMQWPLLAVKLYAFLEFNATLSLHRLHGQWPLLAQLRVHGPGPTAARRREMHFSNPQSSTRCCAARRNPAATRPGRSTVHLVAPASRVQSSALYEGMLVYSWQAFVPAWRSRRC